jgi:hypothetical protein
MKMSDLPRESARPDPLIDEVRRVRAALSAQFGHDVRRLCEYLRSVEAQYPERLVVRRRANSRQK